MRIAAQSAFIAVKSAATIISGAGMRRLLRTVRYVMLTVRYKAHEAFRGVTDRVVQAVLKSATTT